MEGEKNRGEGLDNPVALPVPWEEACQGPTAGRKEGVPGRISYNRWHAGMRLDSTGSLTNGLFGENASIEITEELS